MPLPFGDTQEQSGMLPRQRFTGQERDGVAGLDDFNARSLPMRTGRMNRPDPLFGNAPVNPQRWNAYSYVTNNPLGFVDPSGNLETTPLVFRSRVTVCVSCCVSCLAPGWAGVHANVQSSVFDTVSYLNFAFESGDGGFGVGADEGCGGGGQPPLPPSPNLPKGDPFKLTNPELVKQTVVGPGCEVREMLVTASHDEGQGADTRYRHGTAARYVGPGTVAVANTKPPAYPFGTLFQVLGNQGEVLYAGEAHDTAAGWNASHHNVNPADWIDIWIRSKPPAHPAQGAFLWGKQWRLTRICQR